MPRIPRVRLRTFFLAIFAAAVGLTIGTQPSPDDDGSWFAWLDWYDLVLNWYYALLAAASVAIVVGLLQQTLQLLRLRTGGVQSISFARWYGIVWRSGIAAVIVVCLVIVLLLTRQIVTLPETESFFGSDLFPYIVWQCCILLVLLNGVSR